MALIAQRVLVMADDLSGAAEVAAALMSRRTRTSIALTPAVARCQDQPDRCSADVLVLDLDTRHSSGTEAASRVAHGLDAADDRLVYKKVDSLLRGHIASEVAALTATPGPVVFASALPSLQRTVRDGVVRLAGVPLHETAAWEAERSAPPVSVSASLGAVGSVLLDLATVRSGRLAEAISAASSSGLVAVCDAETDADLDEVVAAALHVSGARLVGSGGLAAARGRRLRADGTSVPEAASEPLTSAASPRRPGRSMAALRAGESCPGGGSRLLLVAGSADPGIAEQVRRVSELGATHVRLPAAMLLHDAERPLLVKRLSAALAAETTVVTIEATQGVRPSAARALAARLTEVVASAVRASHEPVDLVLTGGETARHVLDALGVKELTPVRQIHHGAVHCLAPEGFSVVTRPGSFGDADSLADIAAALRHTVPFSSTALSDSDTPERSSHMSAAITTSEADSHGRVDGPGPTPIIAVTMGDGAGVGPEVTVGALLDAEIAALCRPVVIGDATRLRQAAEILGVQADVVEIETIADATFTPGRINVIDLDLLPEDLPWGQLSAVAGDAAYHYIRVASELALRGEVQGICTAPLNKEALHAAGHNYPGHTELLAELTGTPEVSMMLSSPNLRVIHVTTHIGLIDAVNKIEPGLVERTVRRGHDALVRAGIPNPRIGVCGINPHAGENGLFGYGEEEEKILPALKILQADGIDARGPLPADTAFFVAGRGDYDLVVAMYHDQGHGPMKVLGVDDGVNITVGLPVIRTSVDHGTAFDIAGKGVVTIGSMIEALRQAARMSPRPTT